MTNAHKVTLALALVLAGISIYTIYGWVSEHVASQVIAAQQKADQAAQATIAQHEAANQAQLATALQQYATMRTQVQTPAQVVQALPQVIQLPAPIQQVTAAQAQASNAAGLPDAPKLSTGDLIIPQADAKSFYDSQLDCKVGAVKLSSCQQTTANDSDMIAAKNTEIKQLQTAVKGGTKWQRTKRALLWAGVGAGIGAGAVAYHDHH